MFTWLAKIPLMSFAKPRAWQRAREGEACTVEIAPAPDACPTWSPATIVSGRPMVQLFAELDVINTSPHRVVLVSAKLRKPATEGLVRVHTSHRGTPGSCVLEPLASARASVYFFVTLALPPVATNVVADVGLVDQMGGVHWVDRIRFAPQDRPAPPAGPI